MLAELESSRARLLAEVEGLRDPRFITTPRHGGWSASHVIQHLTKSEDAIARGIELGNAGRLKAKSRASDPWRRLFYHTNLYRVMPFRTGGFADPEHPVGRTDAMSGIASSRTRLLAAIEDGERRGLWTYRMRHPVLGILSMNEMLRFSAYHEERHRLQIVRIKAALAREGK